MARIVCDGEEHGESFTAYWGDCVSVCQQFPDECIDFSVYSPPFGSLFVYSDSAADMGNSTDEEFAEHYAFLVREKFRLTKPGRLTAVHCSDLPMTKWKDGTVGIKDFSGQIINIHCSSEVQRIQEAIKAVAIKAMRHENEGDFAASSRCLDLAERLREELNSAASADGSWIEHSRRTIWKNPVTEMTRTKHVGVLYKQLVKDSAKSRGGMPDYLLTFVKPGDNAEPIIHDMGEETAKALGRKRENIGGHIFSLDQWQEWASPVWMTIDQSNVLNVKMAKDGQDERHLCPLQLDVIERAVIMWSNPGNVVLSPFMGIGSEGVTSLKLGRKFVGIEKKDSYWRQACQYMNEVDRQEDAISGRAA